MGNRYGMKEFAEEHGLTLGSHCCYGVYNGFRIHIRYRVMGNPSCLLTVITDTKGKNKDLEKYLEKNKRELKITNYGVVGIGLMVTPQLYFKVFTQLKDILDKLTAHLRKAGFPGADVCPYCGTPLDEHSVDMLESGIPFRAHARCFEGALAGAKQREAEEEAKPDHKLAASGGALLGALVGGALLVLLYIWWSFSSLAAAVGVLLGAYFYGKFGGKNTAYKVAFCAASTAVVSVLFFGFSLVMQEYADAGSFAASIDAIGARLSSESDYRLNVILNFAFLFVFVLVASAYTLFSYLRSRKKISVQMHRTDGGQGGEKC